jgi:hypothetical protein
MTKISLLVLFFAAAASAQVNPSGRVSVLEFGGAGDGVTDNSPAFNRALIAAMPTGLTIFFPCGIFRFASRPAVIGSGIKIVGCGTAGSTIGYGTSLVADYDEYSPEQALFTWDGSFGTCCAGTGGGIERVSIFKAANRTGGTAIKITGTNDQHRAGYTSISGILIGSAGGTWDHNLIIDGSCCTASQTQGVRDTYISNFWAAGATSPGESVLLRSAVQVFWHSGEIMPASLGVQTGISIIGGSAPTSNSVNILVSDVYVAGSLSISNAKTVTFRGYVGGSATIASSASDVFLSGIVNGVITNKSQTAIVYTNKLVSFPSSSEFITPTIETGSSGSTDLAGQVQLTNGKGSYMFQRSYVNAPVCMARDSTSVNPVSVQITNTTLSFTGSAGDLIDFICIARN